MFKTTFSGFTVTIAAAALMAVAGCQGGGDQESAGGDAGKAAGGEGEATMEQLSADAKSCLELVKAKNYTEAIAPCQAAVKAGANTDVEKALEEAKAALAEKGGDAAMKAAGEAMEGKPAGEAAKDAMKGMGAH